MGVGAGTPSWASNAQDRALALPRQSTPSSVMRFPLLPFFIALLFGSCTFGPADRSIVATGIKYIVPLEASKHDDFGGFDYKGDSLAASEKNGRLTVDGQAYGFVKQGDTVNLTRRGR